MLNAGRLFAAAIKPEVIGFLNGTPIIADVQIKGMSRKTADKIADLCESRIEFARLADIALTAIRVRYPEMTLTQSEHLASLCATAATAAWPCTKDDQINAMERVLKGYEFCIWEDRVDGSEGLLQ